MAKPKHKLKERLELLLYIATAEAAGRVITFFKAARRLGKTYDQLLDLVQDNNDLVCIRAGQSYAQNEIHLTKRCSDVVNRRELL